jgi:hypothetical protein
MHKRRHDRFSQPLWNKCRDHDDEWKKGDKSLSGQCHTPVDKGGLQQSLPNLPGNGSLHNPAKRINSLSNRLMRL